MELVTPPLSEPSQLDDEDSSLTGGGSSRGGHENKEALSPTSEHQNNKKYGEMVWRPKKAETSD
jgi:hypothetical protein